MADTTKTYTTTDAEFIAALEAAASAGEPLRIKTVSGSYLVRVQPEDRDLWEGYDPERVIAALEANAALPGRASREEVDDIITEIKAQRGQDSSGRPASH